AFRGPGPRLRPGRQPGAGPAVARGCVRAGAGRGRAAQRGRDRRNAGVGRGARRDRHQGGDRSGAGGPPARPARRRAARRGDRRQERSGGGARLDRGVRPHRRRPGRAGARPGSAHGHLHRCGARRHACRARHRGRARARGARARRHRVGGRRVARRPARRARRGTGGRDRGPRAVRGEGHPPRGAAMRGRLTPGLALLRATGFSALLLLLWNPITTHRRAGGRVDQPLVLLDASLSMAGRGGRWREALDSARALARGGVIWRFGTQVAAFDSAPPADGASRLAPALTAAAARGGPIAVVTDGELKDVAGLAPDLLRLPHVVVLPRAPFRDAFVAAVEGPPAVAVTDTMRLRVSYGVAGKRETGNEKRAATIAVTNEGRRLASSGVQLPDS